MLIRYAGLDSHKDSIKIEIAEEGGEPARFYASIPSENNKLISRIRKHGPEN